MRLEGTMFFDDDDFKGSFIRIVWLLESFINGDVFDTEKLSEHFTVVE